MSSFYDNLLTWVQQTSSQLAQQTTYAKQYYAQQANLAFQSGGGNNWAAASFWDAIGGFVALGTGNPQSPGQALWSIVFSVPGAGVAGAIQTTMGTTSAISSMFSSIGSQTPMSLSDWASSMIGMGGSWIGAKGDAFVGSGNFLSQLGVQIGGKEQLLLSDAGQRLSNIGQVFNVAANGIAWGGFLDNANQTFKGLSEQVGGVLFDYCDCVLTGIDEIAGAYWDDLSGSIVLVGRPDAGGKRLNLPIPALDADHLKVAVRAASAGQPLGVSIDPPANYRYGKNSSEMLPDGSPLIVSYLGDTAGTLFGAIMFESDRIMKCLSVGMDNRTRKPCTAEVPGFRDLFTKSKGPNNGQGKSWHRFWFVIDSVKLRRASQSNAILVDDVQIKVLTELEMPGSPKGQGVDPNDHAFAEHLTKHYDAYARQFPVFGRLKELAKISAITRFLLAQTIPFDIGVLFQELPARVATPETTPSILRTESTTQRTHQMSGGVDLDVDPEILPDSAGKTDDFYQAVKAARKSSSTVWSVQWATKSLQARSIPLTAPPAFRQIVMDHCFPSTHGTASLVFKRIYDSGLVNEGDFGPGWNLFLPYSMKIIRRGGKKVEVLSEEENSPTNVHPNLLIVRATDTGTTTIYRPTTSTQSANVVYARVKAQTISKGSVSFEYDPTDVIDLRASCFYLDRQGISYVFALDGRLIEIHEADNHIVRLGYDKNQLVRMSNDAGQSYEFSRDRQGSNVVTGVRTSENPLTLAFLYDESGHLKQTEGGTLAKHRYSYGLRGQLAQIRDRITNVSSVVPQQNMALTDDVVHLPFESSFRRKWAAGSLTSIEDNFGSRADFTYGSNSLKRISIRGRDGTNRNFDFDDDGRLRIGPDSGRQAPIFADSSVTINSDVQTPRMPSARKLGGNVRNGADSVSITRSQTANALIVHFC